MIGPAGFMAAPKADRRASIVRRMEHIREELDENDDLTPKERKEMTHEYRLLRAALSADGAP